MVGHVLVNRLSLVILTVVGASVQAAQFGPVFPSHRFPTDSSYHLGYGFSTAKSRSNYDGSSSTSKLLTSGEVSVQEHLFDLEYQPTRYLSVGAYFTLVSTKISDKVASNKATGMGDQRIFTEYRFFDEVGKSAGFAFMVKFPGYKNATATEVNRGKARVALRGDAQSDFTGFLSTELWASSTIRTRVDFGYTYRTDQFAAELPYQVSIAYVNPQLDIDLRLKGNFSMGNDSYATKNSDIGVVQRAFGSSDYALAKNPWILSIEPNLSYWFAPEWSADLTYAQSLMGNNAPSFYKFTVGMTYRWAQTRVKKPRNYKDVSIDTDQEKGKFQADSEGQLIEPRATSPEVIREEPDEEFPDPGVM